MTLYRAFFKKQEEAAFISHLDLQRVIAQAVRKAALPVWFTEGYNPRIYLSFALPLSLGIESTYETFDFKSDTSITEEHIQKLNQHILPGITVVKIAPAKNKPAVISSASYEVHYPLVAKEKVQHAVNLFQMLSTVMVEKTSKKKGVSELNLKEHLKNLSYAENEQEVLINFTLPAGNQFTINPSLVCDYFEKASNIEQAPVIVRTGIYTNSDELFE